MHLMTGPEGNSDFCFPETLNVPRGEAEGNVEVEGEQNSLFPMGPVIKGAFVWDQSGIRIIGIMQVSVCLGAILIPEYLDSILAPRSIIAGIYSGIHSHSGIFPNERALSVLLHLPTQGGTIH